MKKRNKLGQEELVGFGMIVILVSVILVVFLWLSINKPVKDSVESYEVESFIQAILQYNTDCIAENNQEYLSIQDMISICYNGERCSDDRDSCNVLNSTLKGIIKESWSVGEDTPAKGYNLDILSDIQEILVLNQGSRTNNYKAGTQIFDMSGREIKLSFKVYY
ncbi:MAG: hypothetical protein AABW81_01930 [Nanoarchaeota archaeon]